MEAKRAEQSNGEAAERGLSRDIEDSDIDAIGGRTDLYFDAGSGELRLLLLPTGQYSGNTVTTWLYHLHTANVFGLPYRIFVRPRARHHHAVRYRGLCLVE